MPAWELAADGIAEVYRLMDTHLDIPAAWRLTQAAPAPGAPGAGTPGRGPEASETSASELNKQLSNQVTSLWSLAFQSNNYRLENGEWNYNLQFPPTSRGVSTGSTITHARRRQTSASTI